MARVTRLTIRGFRSIRDEVSIRFPENAPVILVGENNAGKSNIIRALELILGEQWPGSKQPEDHDFWGRSTSSAPIEIVCELQGVTSPRGAVRRLIWRYNPTNSEERPFFRAEIDTGYRNEIRTVSNEIRNQCMCVVVGADRRLSYHLSYASKYTLLSKLMRRFHAHLTRDLQRVERLKQKFEEIKAIFEEVTEFAHFQGELRNQFADMYGGMTYGLQVDFSAYDPTNFFHSLRLLPEENGVVRTFEELGTGQEQLLALVFAHAYAKAFFGGIVLVIEEPEAHLHPLAQQWLARKIHDMARDGLQVVLTTHSPHFVDLLGLEGLVLVRKENGMTKITQLMAEDLVRYCREHGAHPERTTPESILPFYASHATEEILNGFFARKVVLVEGQTEALALPVYLRRVGLDVRKEGIAIIPVMGKGNLAKWWRLFTAYGIPTFITFDNDTRKDANGTKRRDALRTLGVLEDEIDEILNYNDWHIADQYCVFGEDFETTMRNSFRGYAALEEEARRIMGRNSKPLIARYVAHHLEVSFDESGWRKFSELAEKLRNL